MYYNLFYELIQVAIGRRGSLSRVPSAEEWSMLYGLALKFFELKTKESQEIVNSQLIEFLEEWRQDAPLAIGRQRMISAIGLPTSGIASSRPCRR